MTEANTMSTPDEILASADGVAAMGRLPRARDATP